MRHSIFLLFLCSIFNVHLSMGQSQTTPNTTVVAPLSVKKVFVEPIPNQNSQRSSRSGIRCFYNRMLSCNISDYTIDLWSLPSLHEEFLVVTQTVRFSSKGIDGKYRLYFDQPGRYEFILHEIGKDPFIFNQRIHEAKTTVTIELNDSDEVAIVFN